MRRHEVLSLAELLDERCVLLDVKAKKKTKIIAALVNSVSDAGLIDDPDRITRLVLEREKRASTGIGKGAAIPHWLGEGIDRTIMAFARCATGISFGSIDGMPVRLLFLILGPAGYPNEHLQLLSRLSRILHSDSCIDKLLSAAEPHQIRQVLEREAVS